ncbi:hypothetical protein PUNSTDRAFT_94087 [Punctularia strigosozonata HHB-11173 SS5]|uniref:uncharacterized protein n=1 Tax=Punctularia strigosozonata (strain HHB-11173) TaxID=741275 RepID=UPI00044172FD|nr:uncharacterized protein PUNSTDRAFT_94087 [Punctularia strigosozonata HHB-11173 SS5]EIN13120.1 hypothetical protein PUNSTDRAFT_94087 [Punctularia strigosozonata HHB-11173 SS5]
MELGSHSSAKLEPFLLMGKSAKGAAAAKLAQDATAAPGVFVFAELLELPGIRELANNAQYAKQYALLQLFSYKTYQDYSLHKDDYPPLNQAQITKLKHLSLVSLAADRRILPYADLLRFLDMPTIRDLEDLVIDAIYLDILRGKLDQKEQQLEVEYTMGRDLAPGKVEHVLAALKDWATTTSSVLATLDAKLSSLSAQAQVTKDAQLAYTASVDALLKDVLAKKTADKRGGGPANSGGGSSSLRGALRPDDAMMMDVDTEEGGATKGKSRRGLFDFGARGQRKRNRF